MSGQGAGTNNSSPFNSFNPFQQNRQNNNSWFQPKAFNTNSNNASNTNASMQSNQQPVGFFANNNTQGGAGFGNVNGSNVNQNNSFQNRNPKQQKRGGFGLTRGGKQANTPQDFNSSNNQSEQQSNGFAMSSQNMGNFANQKSQVFNSVSQSNPFVNKPTHFSAFSQPTTTTSPFNENAKNFSNGSNFDINTSNNSNNDFNQNQNQRKKKNKQKFGKPLLAVPTLPTASGFKPRVRSHVNAPIYLLGNSASSTKITQRPDAWDLQNQQNMLEIEKLRFQGIDLESIYSKVYTSLLPFINSFDSNLFVAFSFKECAKMSVPKWKSVDSLIS